MYNESVVEPILFQSEERNSKAHEVTAKGAMRNLGSEVGVFVEPVVMIRFCSPLFLKQRPS